MKSAQALALRRFCWIFPNAISIGFEDEVFGRISNLSCRLVAYAVNFLEPDSIDSLINGRAIESDKV